VAFFSFVTHSSSSPFSLVCFWIGMVELGLIFQKKILKGITKGVTKKKQQQKVERRREEND
jgi:hypothetical protein